MGFRRAGARDFEHSNFGILIFMNRVKNYTLRLLITVHVCPFSIFTFIAGIIQ